MKERSFRRRAGLDVLVVVEHVLGVVLRFDVGEAPVGVVAVGSRTRLVSSSESRKFT